MQSPPGSARTEGQTIVRVLCPSKPLDTPPEDFLQTLRRGVPFLALSSQPSRRVGTSPAEGFAQERPAWKTSLVSFRWASFRYGRR